MRPMLIAAAVLCSTCALAEPVSLVSGDDYAPYADRKLPEGGMTTEIVSKAFAAVKQEVKVAWLPWARGFDEAKNGTYAGTFPYLKNAERERDFLYSNLLIKLQDRAFVKAGNAGKFDFSKPESLAGTKICLPLGWATTPKLAEMLKSEKIKKESPKDISTCVKMVANDRADYFVSDEAQGLAALETGDYTKRLSGDARCGSGRQLAVPHCRQVTARQQGPDRQLQQGNGNYPERRNLRKNREGTFEVVRQSMRDVTRE
ncbi:MAG: transporter substrate-binding domain-containing protein [Rhodocyclaceae bacterium]|nr:transporter substrate-binding domain-containing protein [Rhodocyclaceae bacterium]